MDLRGWLAVGVLACTIAAILARPRRLGEGTAALAGAAAVVALGLVSPAEAARTLLRNLDLPASVRIMGEGHRDPGLHGRRGGPCGPGACTGAGGSYWPSR